MNFRPTDATDSTITVEWDQQEPGTGTVQRPVESYELSWFNSEAVELVGRKDLAPIRILVHDLKPSNGD